MRKEHSGQAVTLAGWVEGIVNRKIPTGEIEIDADSLTVLNRTAVVPFQPSAPEVPAEETRLKYRYFPKLAGIAFHLPPC